MEKVKKTQEGNLWRIARACRKGWRQLLLLPLAFGMAILLLTAIFVAPVYTASVQIYVSNAPIGANSGVSPSDLSASTQMVALFGAFLSTDDTLSLILEDTGMDLSIAQLRSRISTSSVDGTQILEVSATGSTPEEAYQLAAAIGERLPQVLSQILPGADAVIVSHARLPEHRSAPDYLANALIGALIGLAVGFLHIAAASMQDPTIYGESDIQRVTQIPVLIRCGGESSICGGLSIEEAEAYKMLRMQIRLLLPRTSEKGSGQVIGITSPLPGEGKTLTAINLAYTLAETGERVCLLEADLREPEIGPILGRKPEPGLTDLLSRRCGGAEAIQELKLAKGIKLYVIAAGQTSPDPAELLISEGMQTVLAALREHFAYIVVSLPSAAMVSDALAFAPNLDGAILTLRRGVCDEGSLQTVDGQFALAGTKVLGIVLRE